MANLEAAVDRYRLQEEEWQTKLNQSDGQARVILVMSEQVSPCLRKTHLPCNPLVFPSLPISHLQFGDIRQRSKAPATGKQPPVAPAMIESRPS